jgi:hypothetical protein
MSVALQEALRDNLKEWRDEELIDAIFPGTTSISGATLLSDDVILKLSTCGTRVETQEHLQQQTRWYLAFNKQTGNLTAVGEQLLKRLHDVYEEYDRKVEAAKDAIPPPPSNPTTITPAMFYGEEERSVQRGGGGHSQAWGRGQSQRVQGGRGRGGRGSRSSGGRRGRPQRAAASTS